MKVLIWKYIIGPSFQYQVLEDYLTRQKTYIHDPKRNEKEKIAYAFEGSNNKEILTIVAGYDPRKASIEKIWVTKCRQEEYSLKLKINAFKNLNELEIAQLKNLYEISTSSGTTHRLETTPSYLFVKDLPKRKLVDIIYESNHYSLKKSIQNIYQPGAYSSLSTEAIYQYEIEQNLHPLAQRSKYAKRPLGIIPPDESRNEFQRDKERIIHSKAFRRTVDKAQVYNTSKGDHYRKRLTHSLEVSQIARAVGRQLKLHEDLIEAIAIGHDVGHTPFGHEGERQLDLIMSGKIQLLSGHEAEHLGGFKHNYQSVRLVNYLEEKYADYEGLDISFQVMEGMLKHTSIKQHKIGKRNCDDCLTGCFKIDDFLIIGNESFLHLDKDFCSTLEGQVVAIADEIAQRGHDLDDGIASRVLSIDILVEEISNEAAKDTRMNKLKELVLDCLHKVQKSGREYVDEEDLKRAVITPAILGYFMQNLIKNSQAKMKEYSAKYPDFNCAPVIEEQVIEFHEDDKFVLDKLEEIIKSRIINSQEVNCFDGKSAYIIRKLFKAYYCNPRQLPDNTIKRINKELKLLNIPYVDIRKGKKDDVESEIRIFQGLQSSENDAQDFAKYNIFMRSITDLISGMTDDYANAQFQNLYIS